MLACTGGGDEWLRSEKLYRDFRLTMEYRMSAGVHSGVHVRSTERMADQCPLAARRSARFS